MRIKIPDRIWLKLGYWLPQRLVYFAVIRAWAHASLFYPGKLVDHEDISVAEVLDIWEVRHVSSYKEEDDEVSN